MNQDLQNYIKQMQGAEKSDEKIKLELKNTGWTDEQINVGLQSDIIPGSPPVKDQRIPKPKPPLWIGGSSVAVYN